MKRPATATARTWTLRNRLLRNVLLAVSGGWIVTAAVGTFALNYEMREMLDRTMESDAALVLHMLEATDGATISHWVESTPDTDTQLVRVYTFGQAIPPAPWPILNEDGFARFDDWLVLRRSSGVGIVEFGQSLDWRFEELMEAARAFLLLIMPLLLLVTLGVIAALRAGLRGLSAFSRKIHDRRPDDLSPLPVQDLPQELRILADGLNQYLDRIHDLRQAERSFIANAAHELRTPLAIIRTRLQLIAENRANAPDPAEIILSIDHLSRRVERLLQLERAEAGLGLVRQKVDLVGLIRMLCAEQRVDSRSLVFDDADLESSEVISDPDALAIILRNLLENALEHGEGPVRLSLRTGPVVVIQNRAPGHAELSIERFAKSRLSSGYGLGLSIVTRLCTNLEIGLRLQTNDRQIEAHLEF